MRHIPKENLEEGKHETKTFEDLFTMLQQQRRQQQQHVVSLGFRSILQVGGSSKSLSGLSAQTFMVT